MIVYRYATENELHSVLNNETGNIGRYYIRSACNTHKYNRNKKYLHFFKDKKSIKEIQEIRKVDGKKYFICEYDIPMLVLMLGRGMGYYKPHGYKCEFSIHIEYVIPVNIFKPKWLKSYVLDETTIDLISIKSAN